LDMVSLLEMWLHKGRTLWPGSDNTNAKNVPCGCSPKWVARGPRDALGSAESFDRIRDRLIAALASDGRVDSCGAFHTLWFIDPDGMRGEVALVVDATLQGIHEPRALRDASTA